MRFKLARLGDARLNQFFDVARAIFTALGVAAHVGFERGAGDAQRIWEAEQFEKAGVADNEIKVGINHRDALADVADGIAQHGQ